MRFLSRVCLAVLVCTTFAQALPQPFGQDVLYRLESSDTITSVARQFGLAPDHILWANGLSRLMDPPGPGREVVIPLRRIPPFTPPESTAIVLNLPERILYLFREGELKEYWGVAIGGSDHRTPTGIFSILDKEEDPIWEPPAWLQREPVGPGPDNPLGDRWLQITPGMVGIHGTNDPETIGGFSSLGCVRLYPEAIRSVYDQVSVGTKVYVIYEQVRVGEDSAGTLIWSFFPDPYRKGYAVAQAQEALRWAREDGHDVRLSDFEIEQRKNTPNGRLAPVFGQPLEIAPATASERPMVYRKSTGIWFNPQILEPLGYTVHRSEEAIVIESPTGKQAVVRPVEVPLNPQRLPHGTAILKLEGHRWEGVTWSPFPMLLDYFQIDYQWESEASRLTIK